MKKILIAGLVSVGLLSGAYATGHDRNSGNPGHWEQDAHHIKKDKDDKDDNCEIPVKPQPPIKDPKPPKPPKPPVIVDCEPCKDGVDGQDGESIVGPKGDKGDKGDPGESIKGDKGDKGDPGIDGLSIKGDDGTDGIVDYSIVNNYFKKQQEYTAATSAGANAMATLDFGTVCKGMTEVGIGAGVSDVDGTRGYAGAVGLKHGLTEVDAVIVKAWVGNNSTKGAGVALTHRF